MLFERKIVKNGSSNAIIIPIDILKFLGFEEGTEILMKAEEGKHGKFVSFWRKDQNKDDGI